MTQINKKIVLLAAVLSAILGLYIMDRVSLLGDEEDFTTLPTSENRVVVEFKSYCDSMISKPYNTTEFQKRVDRLNVYTDHGLIKPTQKPDLEEYIYFAYAESLHKSYLTWKLSCVPGDLHLLGTEIKNISTKNRKCKSFLASDLSSINQFYKSMSLPAKISELISEEFSQEKFNTLKNTLVDKPSNVLNCPKISNIYTEGVLTLNEYENYCNKFISLKILYESDSADFYKRRDLEKLCPSNNSQTSKYSFYRNSLYDLKICN